MSHVGLANVLRAVTKQASSQKALVYHAQLQVVSMTLLAPRRELDDRKGNAVQLAAPEEKREEIGNGEQGAAVSEIEEDRVEDREGEGEGSREEGFGAEKDGGDRELRGGGESGVVEKGDQNL